MDDRERIQELTRRLRDMERRQVTAWERPILEVARQALAAEICVLARNLSRWDQMFRKPVLAGNR